MPTPPRTPAENFAALLAWLSGSVAAMSGGDRLSYLLISRIIDRLRGIKQGFARLAARIAAGTYAPRHYSTPRRPPAVRQPRQPGKLPQTFGWLLKLVPNAVGSRSQLQYLFRDPAMAELMAAAPTSLGRPLRSLCHMLGLKPPPIVAAPARPRPPRPPREKQPRPRREPLPPYYPPTPPEAPAWMHGMPRLTRRPKGVAPRRPPKTT
jgi:hypothetical protein